MMVSRLRMLFRESFCDLDLRGGLSGRAQAKLRVEYGVQASD